MVNGVIFKENCPICNKALKHKKMNSGCTHWYVCPNGCYVFDTDEVNGDIVKIFEHSFGFRGGLHRESELTENIRAEIAIWKENNKYLEKIKNKK